jgi:hypothetical protein
MNPQGDPRPTVDNPLAVEQAGEQVICEIKRHPIGIIGVYVAVGFSLVALATLVLIVVPKLLTGYSHSRSVMICLLIIAIATAFGSGLLVIFNKVYWGNRWIVTTDSITQITRTSLSNKQSSQLSLADLEDITAEQNGLLAQILHYGVISAETAAATDKFTFMYCPNPNFYAQQILNARERFEQNNHAQPASDAPAPTADSPA